MTGETVTVNNDGEILCACMNEPSHDGFRTCHRDGTHDDTLLTLGNDRPVFYHCERCDRIIEETTLKVVGYATCCDCGKAPTTTYEGNDPLCQPCSEAREEARLEGMIYAAERDAEDRYYREGQYAR